LAKFYNAKLTILHVAHDESQLQIVLNAGEYENIKKRMDEEINKNFNKLMNDVALIKELEVNTVIRRGVPYVEGLIEIEKNIYDLVVLGSHGHTGIKKFYYGSTAEKIVRRSNISVHITRT
jgi:nucleotide-binding universal stress UspA family protein